MKIQKFESFNSHFFTKDYGQKYPISELKSGDEILYRGSRCAVLEPNEYAVKVVSHQGHKFLINQSLFNEFGAIPKKS